MKQEREGEKRMEINNLEWEVIEIVKGDERLKDKEGKDCYGVCEFYENKIYLDKGLCENLKMKVLAHELTHAYIYSHLLTTPEQYSEEELCEFVSCYGKGIWNQVDEYFFHKEIDMRREEEKRSAGGKK